MGRSLNGWKGELFRRFAFGPANSIEEEENEEKRAGVLDMRRNDHSRVTSTAPGPPLFTPSKAASWIRWAMEANHPHLTTQETLYVEISRARDRAVTDDRNALRERLEAATGERIAARKAVEPEKGRRSEPVHGRKHEGRSAESREWVPESEKTREQPKSGRRCKAVLPLVNRQATRHHFGMIASFKHRGLKALYRTARRVASEHVEKLKDIGRGPNDMDLLGFRLHALKGKMKRPLCRFGIGELARDFPIRRRVRS